MRKKNALRKHYIAPYTDAGTEPAEDAWLRLAKFITTIEDDSDEDTDDTAFYDGDGTSEDTLLGRAEKWNFEGTFDAADPAHKLIDDMKRKATDEERMLWHKIVETSGKTVIGVAKAMEIKTGSGDASDYEEISGHLDFIGTPKVTAPGTPEVPKE